MKDKAIRAAIEAATWAPSVHNTQPWTFGVAGEEISLRADVERKLRVSDPSARELLVSCGAALLNLRVALRAEGYEPIVRVLPDPDRPSLLATVRPGAPVRPDEATRTLAGEIRRRRTHRAGFTDLPVPDRLIERLVREAAAEKATLTPVRSAAAVDVLAALTQAAQAVQVQDRAFSLELMRWARPPGSPRRDGVPAEAYPRGGWPGRFPQRDYAHGQDWGKPGDQGMAGSTGLVAVLTTPGDTRESWLAAGQALERVLLHASAYGVSAAFHTQALEMYHLREFLRHELCSDQYPQTIMRLGITFEDSRAVRRTPAEVLD
ncbi:Acg family FMN-binding oxidoreductase [Thermoactinospora rubra]|uniref:Acg family FMN-binding oxidoreductase n=1 Tax=Thermoactinospora rubra TaxID=1088767 RepID=UPI000A11AFBA|nr:nitroreductase family protein [Thermoactinospora rubra]